MNVPDVHDASFGVTVLLLALPCGVYRDLMSTVTEARPLDPSSDYHMTTDFDLTKLGNEGCHSALRKICDT